MSPYESSLLDAIKRERDPALYNVNLWFRPKVKVEAVRSKAVFELEEKR